MTVSGLSIWTVYDHPTDYPEFFVARRFEDETPTSEVIVAPQIGLLRDYLAARGLYRIQRFEDDDAKIVEVWL